MKNKWNLVIHEVTSKSAVIWVGTLFPDLRKPETLVVSVTDKKSSKPVDKRILKNDWDRPFKKITTQRFCKVLEYSQLVHATDYEVKVYEIVKGPDGKDKNIELVTGSFTTFPNTLSELDDGFTVALGSCFYEEYDGGNVGLSYETLVRATEFPFKPHVKFLTGDQVYLDIGWDSLSLISKEIRERVANDYALHWQALRRMLRHGSTFFLSDDHEFWNNYPLVQGWSPFIQALRIPSVKSAWLGTAKDGVKNIQRIQPVRMFSISNEVSFCLVDLRAYRTKSNILPDDQLVKVLDWINNLSSPGVLVLSQPLMVRESSDTDRNFPFYRRQYRKVVKAINDAAHDVLTLSGDVHHGRISSVEFKNRTNKLYEVVSSPLSNLSGISSIATSTADAKSRLRRFPPISVQGVETTSIKYGKNWKISSESSFFDFRYMQKRTNEHFTTLTFNLAENGKLKVNVKAWLVRKRNKKNGLPKQEWGNSNVDIYLG